MLQPNLFLHWFLHVPAPSLLLCGDVEANPGPTDSTFDESEAIQDLQKSRYFTFKLRAHVLNLISHAEYSARDFEELEYKTNIVKEGVFHLLAHSAVSPERSQSLSPSLRSKKKVAARKVKRDSAPDSVQSRVRQNNTSARTIAREALHDEVRATNRQNNTSARIVVRAALPHEISSAHRKNNTSGRLRARKNSNVGRHPTPCIGMTGQEILDDRQQPIPFVLSPCPHCKCLRDKSEARLCCNNGKKIISYDDFPIWPPEFLIQSGTSERNHVN